MALVIALVGALGFVFWHNFMQAKTLTSKTAPVTTTSAQTTKPLAITTPTNSSPSTHTTNTAPTTTVPNPYTTLTFRIELSYKDYLVGGYCQTAFAIYGNSSTCINTADFNNLLSSNSDAIKKQTGGVPGTDYSMNVTALVEFTTEQRQKSISPSSPYITVSILHIYKTTKVIVGPKDPIVY